MGFKPQQLVGAVVRCLRAERAAMIWGSPGVGKTELVFSEIGPALGLEVWDFRANSKEPVDLRGLPAVDKERQVTTWVRPEDLPIEPALIFADEINTCAKSMESPLYYIIHEKRLGNWVGHKDTRIIAAGNRETDRAVANRMSTALLTRMGHFDIEVDADQWCQWASRSGRISGQMIGFIRRFPGSLTKFDPAARTSPIPRTVEAADRVWKQNPPDSTALDELAAHVGEGFAGEFIAFCTLWGRMPDIDQVIRDPKGSPLPEGKDGMSIRFATAVALSQRMSKKNMANVVLYLDRLGEEFSVFAMKDALARDPDLAVDNREFVKWGANHSDLLG